MSRPPDTNKLTLDDVDAELEFDGVFEWPPEALPALDLSSVQNSQFIPLI